MASEAALIRKREAAYKRLQKAKAPQPPIPGWAAARSKAFTYLAGEFRLQIRPDRYRGLTPVMDSIDDLAMPGWNLREAMAMAEVVALKRDRGHIRAAAKEVDAVLDRFLQGPLPRHQLADLFGVSRDFLLARARKVGAWTKTSPDKRHPYEVLVLRMLGEELGQQYLAEVKAETAAQAQLLKIEFSRVDTDIGEHIGKKGAGWTVVSEPFQAWREPGGSLEWWAEVECAVPGCTSNRIQVRVLDDLRKSEAGHCRWCRAAIDPIKHREKSLAWDHQHIPLVLREPARQFTFPLRAQGCLALLEAEAPLTPLLENSSLAEQEFVF